VDGWEHVYPLKLADDELAALTKAIDAIAAGWSVALLGDGGLLEHPFLGPSGPRRS
jgi:hypothetical protein